MHYPTKVTNKRAMLTMRFSLGKLFRMLPCVFFPKVIKPARAIVKQANIDTNVE